MKNFLALGILLTVLLLSCELAAQDVVARATRVTELESLSHSLKLRDAEDRLKAKEVADRLGFPLRRELPSGGVLELQRIAPGIGPIFYISQNIDAADSVSTDEVWPGGSAGLNLDGSGMTIAEWDGGAVADHPDYSDRLEQVDGATLVSGHSTHVAGTLAGNGLGTYAEARGMAFAAYLDAYDWNSDTAEMAAAAALGQLVSNHSYGIAAGWLFIGGAAPDNWWWIGGSDPTDIEDSNFGYYDTETQLWDQIAFDAPFYLPVKASGNDRTDIGPSPGEEYTVIDQDGNFLFTSTLPRNPDCWPGGYDCLPTTSVAKNVLTVGAVDDVPGGYSQLSGPAAVSMADFSSWGPTDDGRIKPDVVGNGVLLLSTWHEFPYYSLGIGTSMATPNVSGSLILLQQHYQDIHGPGNFMRASTLKALAIHTADETGDAPGPDYEFGWGLLNTKTAARVISEDGGGEHQIIEGSLANGGGDAFAINITEADRVITATLVWTDPPGTPPAPALDPPDLLLVNDLDLRITRGPSTWFPWILNPANPAAAATTGDNFRDNVEQVQVTGAGIGSYTLEVTHKGSLLNGQNQDYSIIISIEAPPPSGSGFIIDEDFSGGLPPGWTVDTQSGVNWTIRTPVPGGSKYDNLTGGSGQFAMVDNNYSNRTLTSLRPPVMDLSAATDAILRFKSNFYFDLLESINVDVSTDGGGVWQNVWTFQGFNPFPSQYVLDLSGQIAGQANVMIRFRYDSHGDIQGNYWQIDDIELEVFGGVEPPAGDPPEPASNPAPATGSTNQVLDTNLSWSAGAEATSHDVYFGTSTPPGASEFQGNQSGNSFDPGTLDYETTYYWRIDELNDDGLTQGAIWSFITETEPVVSSELHLADLNGGSMPASNGRWAALIEVMVENQDQGAEAGVTVDGSWSNGANGGASCVTGVDGHCTVSKNNLKKNVSSVMFTVDGLTKSGMNYQPGDNEVGSSVVVNQNDTNQLPSASDDNYQTEVNTAIGGNVMDNDDQGDGPASIQSNTEPSNGSLNLSVDGSFTYTPDFAFEGSDGFNYSIVDSNGDSSNTANVSITVASEPPPPPPPPPGGLTVNTVTYKVRGIQHVEVHWENYSGATVTISRDEEVIPDMPTENDGFHDENLGVKGGGVTYVYEVCETATDNCASATAAF